MNFTDILFDMDGTINESGRGIKSSFRYALEKLGLPAPEDGELDYVIGPPLSWGFEKAGVPAEKIEEAIGLYREVYSGGGLFDSDPYPGIREMLDTLRAAGKHLHIATSKPDNMTLRILDHFHMREYFEVIATATMDESRNTKDAVIAWGLERMTDIPGENIVMVGDRYHDIEGAKVNGLKSVGVLWGYGSERELTEAGADWIVATPEELAALLK